MVMATVLTMMMFIDVFIYKPLVGFVCDVADPVYL